jgi:hypothetical protein
MLAAARPAVENTTPSRGQFFSAAAPGKEQTMANHSKVRTEAEAKFRKTLKATWKGKKVTRRMRSKLGSLAIRPRG